MVKWLRKIEFVEEYYTIGQARVGAVKTTSTTVQPGRGDLDHAAAPRSPGLTPRRPTEYTCPMHANVVSDKRGSCPKCGVELEPKQGGHWSELLSALLRPAMILGLGLAVAQQITGINTVAHASPG
jgi:hypothetical protein